jgi:hypothetical protein
MHLLNGHTPGHFRRIVVAFCLLLGVTGYQVSTAPPAAAATNIQAHVWNLAMGNSTFQLFIDSRDRVSYEVNNNIGSTWTVSLSEICQTQFTTLMGVIDHPFLATSGEFIATRNSPNGCNGADRGNAFIAFGSETGNVVAFTASPYDGSEPRKVICRKVWRFSFLYTPCALHMSSSPSKAELQTQDVFDWWDAVHTTPWMIGGDFNLEYSGSLGLAQFYWTHWEIHLPYPPTPATHDGSQGPRKIDYSYADRTAWGAGPDSSCLVTAVSDHRYCKGYFTV